MIDIRASRHPDLHALDATIYQFGVKKSISWQAISLQIQVFLCYQMLAVKSGSCCRVSCLPDHFISKAHGNQPVSMG
jgi:hypothetical protein